MILKSYQKHKTPGHKDQAPRRVEVVNFELAGAATCSSLRPQARKKKMRMVRDVLQNASEELRESLTVAMQEREPILLKSTTVGVERGKRVSVGFKRPLLRHLNLRVDLRSEQE
jgi:hypothetical protein